MPQMAPYNWLYLNIMFMLMFIGFIMFIHSYKFNFKINSMLILKKKMPFNLKW